MTDFRSIVALLALSGVCGNLEAQTANETKLEMPSFQFGFARIDITPTEPVRLSGYASRSQPHEGIAQKLWTRVMAMKAPGGRLLVLANADTIGFSGELAKQIADRIEKEHGVPRDQFVLAATHSHTAPHLASGLDNIFGGSWTDEERAAAERYTKRFGDSIVAAVGKAVQDLRPGKLFWGQGRVTFAVNRRVLQEGQWSGFGERSEGPVDHLVPVLSVRGADGEIRGIVFNYACHCTTLGGDFNQVCGDWAGYAQEYLEQRFTDAIAICTIGCGADANPKPRGSLDMAQMHGREMAQEVARVIRMRGEEIKDTPTTTFGYAGLPFDRPTIEELQQRLENGNRFEKRHAELMLATHRRMGRLPETYPVPIQIWRFGDHLGMVFLGGEVVVDYAIRLRRELQPDRLWVTAYANDVLGYIASERVRSEGGYEVDYSMIYYGLPGRWSTGTEEILVRRVHELWNAPDAEKLLSPQEALKSWQVIEGFEVEMVASEPLVRDPINIAFGDQGELWVVEMGDYPSGQDGHGSPGGRIRYLEDFDGDGQFDKSTLFLDGLELPTAVIPWKDGVIVAAAPSIFFAADRDGDGRADWRSPLFDGFRRGNPQHRVNGFAYGLDHWIHAGHGSGDGRIRSVATGKKTDTYSRDFGFQPDRGLLEVLGGQAGYVRSRDEWGNWFLGDNSRPIRHHVIADRYLNRNPHVAFPTAVVDLCDPPLNPPVFPTSRTLDRFNDLSTANRFTSACSPMVYRGGLFGPEFASTAFICEPVHNLVHRLRLVPDGATYRGERFTDDAEREFLASSDVWARPVRAVDGPDGALWVVDMYRLVIEHPQWIPEAWQAQLDLRAGHDRGRIYRVYPTGKRPGPIPSVALWEEEKLVASLESPQGALRDSAQRILVHRQAKSVGPALRELAKNSAIPIARLHGLYTLAGLGELSDEVLFFAASDESPGVRRHAARLAEARLNKSPVLARAVAQMAHDPDHTVRLQAALSLGQWNESSAGKALAELAIKDGNDPWLRVAVLSSAKHHAPLLLKEILLNSKESGVRAEWVSPLIETALQTTGQQRAEELLAAILSNESGGVQTWELYALSAFLQAERGVEPNNGLLARSKDGEGAVATRVKRILDDCKRLIQENDHDISRRCAAIALWADVLRNGKRNDVEEVAHLLQPQEPLEVQLAAIDALAKIGAITGADLILDHWSSFSPNVKSRALNALLLRTEWTEHLLEAVENKEFSPSNLNAASRDRLISHRVSAIAERAKKTLADSVNLDREAVLQRYRSEFVNDGDPSRGAKVFSRTCAACHRFQNEGTVLGPDLGALSNKSADYILTAVLDPNRAVEYHYHTYQAVTNDGRVYSGMIVDQNAQRIVLAAANGERHILFRSELEELYASDKSFMPEGLETEINVDEMADLLAYIAQPESL